MNLLPMAKRKSCLLMGLVCVCWLSLFAPVANALAQETVGALALEAAVTVATEVADAEERRHPEESAQPTLSLRHPKPSSPAQMPDDWCGPLWLRPPNSAA